MLALRMRRAALICFAFQGLWGCEEDPVDTVTADAARTDGVVAPDARVDATPPRDMAVRDMARPEPDQAADAHEEDQGPINDAAPDAAEPDAAGCTPRVEACNGSDDDCDTAIDEEVAPTACYSGPAGTADVGACRSGQAACMVGALGACRGEVLPAADDRCGDGIDNNCDGAIDETCVCQAGDMQPCGSDIGACAAGVQTCQGNAFGACMGATGPAPEACDDTDNDCDGLTDEALPAVHCYEGPDGTEGRGTCVAGQRSCVAGAPGACEGQHLPAAADTCGDGLDNDCDGAVDEACGCMAGDLQACGSDVGACAPGMQRCMGGAFGPCEGAVEPAAETCNGVDDNCDGVTDQLNEPCYDGDPATRGVGACRGGTHQCANGAFGACNGQVLPQNVDLCNGVDDDCDGRTDEDFVGMMTACGQGACAAEGVTVCQQGREIDTCTPRAPGANDLCDGLDNDCDGRTDEGHMVQATACGMGACAGQGQRICDAGQVRDTCMPRMPADELQNGNDDDCDDRVDEGFPYTTAELQGRFDRICAGCHGGAGGLVLRPDFQTNTVNVRSGQAPALDRIEPGNPDMSYLYHKLRGTQRDVGGAGSRMPLGGGFWADWEIERLRLWIVAR